MRSLADQVSSHLRELSNLLYAHGVDRYMSLASAAAYSGLSRRSLVRHIHSLRKPLPAFKVGGKWLIKRSEFDRWVEQYRQKPDIDLDEIVRSVLGKGRGRSSRRKKDTSNPQHGLQTQGRNTEQGRRGGNCPDAH